MTPLPRWLTLVVLPLVQFTLALLVSGLVILIIGENPWTALGYLVTGAFGYDEGVGYTLYYATNFIFTGLAVALAFHAGLFNIGGEGQAMLGGLGVGLAALALDAWLPWWLLILIVLPVCAGFGAIWGFVPGYLQARRGSHIVITTIMFNFIASALMVYLLVNVLRDPAQMSPESRPIDPRAWLPTLHELARPLGLELAPTPLNLAFIWALLCCAFVGWLLWHTRWGYAMRAVGADEAAAVYAGIRPDRVVMGTMALAGAMAGFVGINEILGAQHRLLLDFTAGYGFAGIAVALMGRNHPVGIVLAALLFGALYQGGTELVFEMPSVTADLVVVIQGLVILFSGALEFLFLPLAGSLFKRGHRRPLMPRREDGRA